MKDVQITGHTRLGGLLGSPVAHSISPMMHNLSFQTLGIDHVYLCFDIGPEKLGRAVQALRDMNTYGFNLTMPDKEAVLPYLDALSDAARLIGAVNTVVHKDGILTGHNTDGVGFMRSVKENGVEIAGREVTLLGAGGAASAIAVQAALDGASCLHLASRHGKSWEKAGRLVDQINGQTSCRAELIDLHDETSLGTALQASILLINATSVGMEPNISETPIPNVSLLSENLTVADVIYHPRQTRLLQDAAARGLKTFNGMYMLLYQGAEAFRLWTGQEMPVELVKQAYFQ